MTKTRKMYLAALRFSLLWRLPPTEIREVLEDYDGFFAAGLSEGKTESELCSQFGPPREVARAVWREAGGRFQWRAMLTLGLIFLLFLVTAFFGDGAVRLVGWRSYPFWLLVPALCLIWRGSWPLPPLQRREGVSLALLHGLAFAAWLIPSGLCGWLLSLALRGDPLPWQPRYVGTICTYTINICRLLAFALFLLALWHGWRRSGRYFTVSAHCQAALYALLCVDNILHSMNLEGPDFSVPNVVGIYLLGLLSALATALLLWWEWRCQHGRAA